MPAPTVQHIHRKATDLIKTITITNNQTFPVDGVVVDVGAAHVGAEMRTSHQEAA